MSDMNDDDVTRIVQSFANAALDPAQWLPAMSSFSDAISAVCCALELTDLNTGVAVMENSITLEDQLLRHYEDRIFHINPRVKRALPMPVGFIADDRHRAVSGVFTDLFQIGAGEQAAEVRQEGWASPVEQRLLLETLMLPC